MANMVNAADDIEHMAHEGVELLLRSKLQVFRRGSADSTITGSPLLLISVTSAIGGSIVLLLLIFAIRRRNAAAAAARKTQLDDPLPAKSKKTRQEGITALPMYRQDCLASTITPSAVPDVRSPAIEHFEAGHARNRISEKETIVTQVRTIEESPSEEKAGMSSQLGHLEPVLKPHHEGDDFIPPKALQKPKDKIKNMVAKGIASARIQRDLESQCGHGTRPGLEDDRWSWTNSQAPTTPRVRAFSKRFSKSTMDSLPPLPVAQASMLIQNASQKAHIAAASQQTHNSLAQQSGEQSSGTMSPSNRQNSGSDE